MRSPSLASGVLAPAGVHVLYGSPEEGLPVVAAEARIAGVLARAHRVVFNAPAAAVSPGLVEIPGATGQEPDEIAVDGCDDPAGLVGRIRRGIRAGGARLRLSVDPSESWPALSGTEAEADPWAEDLGEKAEVISGADRVVILAGPGVVSDRQVPGLHALARTLGAGVLNTWGAKGIFHWRSRHHWATLGLQRDDFRLAGLEGSDLLVAIGVDDREAADGAWRHWTHLVVDPAEAGPLAEALTPRPSVAGVPALRTRLAAATQAGWVSPGTPIAPSLATLHYGRRLAPGGLVAADAGLAGFWVARTFATTALGAVAVPPYLDPGWAVACVTVARLAEPLRPALAVVDRAIDDTSRAVLDFAAAAGVAVGVEIWAGEGDELTPSAHDARLAELITAPPGVGRATLATDPTQLAAFEAAAGPVREWSPPPPGA
jgi:hypothetical protein